MTKLNIAVLNNYDLGKVENEVSRHEVPNHLLFGTDYLRKIGHTITNFSVTSKLKDKNSFLSGAFYSFLHLENIELQKSVLKRINEFDLIYCLCGGVSEWLYFQSMRKKFKKPILTIYHHPLPNGKLDPIRNFLRKRIFIHQTKILSLANHTAKSFNLMLEKKITQPISWGVDHDFYKRITPCLNNMNGEEIVLTCGRTSRDLNTFSQAIKESLTKAHVICPADEVITLLLDNNLISIDPTTYSRGKKVNTYQKMADLMHMVRVIAIPLEKQNTLAGLTSLMDCLGFGKPVIMTKNPCIDLDIEALGIGTWVEPYDVTGWSRAIKWHFSNANQSRMMGKQAKALGEKLSAESFGQNINKIIIEHYQDWKFN